MSIISDVPLSWDNPQADIADQGSTVHQPDGTLAGGVVLPKNVTFAIPVTSGKFFRDLAYGLTGRGLCVGAELRSRSDTHCAKRV